MSATDETTAGADFRRTTIVAAATPPGHGALGVVRLSGPEVLTVLARHCRPGRSPGGSAWPARRATLAAIHDEHGQKLDTGLVTFFPGPASYTGEDCAEISLHGNPHLLRAFVLAVLTHDRVRPAAGGEFTRRAYLNGKLDLTQAEAVRQVIEARSEYEVRAGQKLLSGALGRLTSRLRSGLIGLKAETEAEVDFSTEDLTFESAEARARRIAGLIVELDETLERGAMARRVAGGMQLALAGVPNAGKSSLLNQILGWERAIVSEIPGTTRDFVSEELHVGGTVLRIVDTAGLHDSTEAIEREGIRRSRKEIERSQLVLHVIDGARPAYPDVAEWLCRRNVIHVVNKADALHSGRWQPTPLEGDAEAVRCVIVSCRTGAGLPELRERIAERVRDQVPAEDALLLEDRHRIHLSAAREALGRMQDLMARDAPPEIVALEVDAALEEIGSITGRVTTEEVLGRIFSVFCVGK